MSVLMMLVSYILHNLEGLNLFNQVREHKPQFYLTKTQSQKLRKLIGKNQDRYVRESVAVVVLNVRFGSIFNLSHQQQDRRLCLLNTEWGWHMHFITSHCGTQIFNYSQQHFTFLSIPSFNFEAWKNSDFICVCVSLYINNICKFIHIHISNMLVCTYICKQGDFKKFMQKWN